jgi:16S rRNA processing protein RimM
MTKKYIFNSIDKAQTLVGCSLYLSLDNLPHIQSETDFYLHEIINYTVVDIQKGKLGVITNVYESNQDLIAMEFQGVEVLIPMADEIVLKVNRATQELYVNLPDGLIDIFLDEKS